MTNPLIRNIIYIHTHDMGRYISPYGYAAPTPNLLDFTRESTLFRQAYCCGPTCSPSRVGLLTGQTPHEAGVYGLAHRGFHLKDATKHLAYYLRDHGFTTALIGVQHEFKSGDPAIPYDHMEALQDTPPASDAEKTAAAIRYIEQAPTEPFFLSFGLFYPHRAFKKASPAEFPQEHIQAPIPLPDMPEIRQDMADYYCSVADADKNIGKVLDTIRKTGRDKDSLIIITTDHGIAFPEMKCNLTDHGIGVTLMLSYPGNPCSGESTEALVSHIDVFPTICDLLGLAQPAHLEGHSMRPLLEKSVSNIRQEVFSEVSFHGSYEPMRCIRTDRYKLIQRWDKTGRRHLANCDGSLSKDILLKNGWAEDILPETELYDLFRDPHERHNIAHVPEMNSILKDLSKRLTDWMHDTQDPLLKGDIEPPPGANFNRPEATTTAEKVITVPEK